MSFLSRENKQMIYIYSIDSKLGIRGLEIVEALNSSIRTININKDKLSSIVWMEIAAMLKCNISDVFSPNHKFIEEELDTEDIVVGDWLNLINQYPSILKNPIAINGSTALRVLDKKNIFEFYSKINSEESAKDVSLYNQNNDSSITRAI